MKELIFWIILYAIYWWLSCIVGNFLYNLTEFNWINDSVRLIFPFLLILITYYAIKLKNRNSSKKVELSKNKFFINSFKIIGMVLLANFLVALFAILYWIINSI